VGLRIIQEPVTEPVSIEEAKLQLRIDGGDEDWIIALYISGARSHAEAITRRSFITQKLSLYLDTFPLYTYGGTLTGYIPLYQSQSPWLAQRQYSVRVRGGRIDLPFPRIQSVDSIKYTDPSGVVQTLATSQYVVDTINEPGAVVPAPGTYWPATQDTVNGVQINYTAGYGNAVDVPAQIKIWILSQVVGMYENRQKYEIGSRLVLIENPSIDRLLDRHRILDYV
jgi:uncharacterized phiE125 gp8 family phage protein